MSEMASSFVNESLLEADYEMFCDIRSVWRCIKNIEKCNYFLDLNSSNICMENNMWLA